MKKTEIAHLAGAFDASGNMKAKIRKKDQTSIGYTFTPMVSVRRPAFYETLLGKFFAYCDERDVEYRSKTKSSNGVESVKIEVVRPRSIKMFLVPFATYLTSMRHPTQLMLNEVLPRIEEGEHLTKQGLYELAGIKEIFSRQTNAGRDAKYTQEYFEEEWDEVG